MRGKLVYLIGAGPGDPGLLTLAGKAALERADVVFYDRLAHPSLLQFCPNAEKIFVGKASARHFVRQEDTNALMVQHAQAGKIVVRLKGGDPFVFGRGGEEAAYLRENGIDFVIVPGISSAIAAPAYAGIPVTHRDASSSFAVITGHERSEVSESGTREAGRAEQRRLWDRIAHAADTLIFLMGVEALEEITARLQEQGRDANTPVALVQWGTWAHQRVVTGTLATIMDIVREAGITAPAVIVVGDVVNYREALRWFDNRPLFGKRIVVTRAREQASALVEQLRELGADPIEFPTIRIAPPDDGYVGVDDILGSLHGNWLVLSSANGVAVLFDRLAHAGKDARALAGCRIAAVGTATAEALLKHGIRADFVPTEFTGEAVAAQLPVESGEQIVLVQAQGAREALREGLVARGAVVEVVTAYQSVPDLSGRDELMEALATGTVDAITFTSSSTVKNFHAARDGVAVPAGVALICIGPVTAQTCRELLREPDAVAENYTVEGLVEVLRRCCVGG